MIEIKGVLEAEKKDQLADFNAEDFKRLEKEDERHWQRKQGETLLSKETSAVEDRVVVRD